MILIGGDFFYGKTLFLTTSKYFTKLTQLLTLAGKQLLVYRIRLVN